MDANVEVILREDLELKALRSEIWALRVQGMPVDRIANHFRLTPYEVYTHLKEARKLMDSTSFLETEAQVDLDRLDLLISTFLPIAVGAPEQGVPSSRDDALLIIKIMERRAKMLGIDAPKRVDVRSIVLQWAAEQGFDPEDFDEVEAVARSVLEGT